MRLLIIGNRGGSNIGESLERAAIAEGHDVTLLAASDAMKGPATLRRLRWHLLGRTPLRLEAFSKQVVACCSTWHPEVVLCTGFAPVNASALKTIGSLGIRRLVFLTDDPWNPAHRADWFLSALGHYDHVFNPRHGNMSTLRDFCQNVAYLRFGYDPDLFFPEPTSLAQPPESDCPILFAGGADAERVPYIASLLSLNLPIRLYGSYWERYPETRSLTKGQLEIAELRRVIARCGIALCLVRRANRDGHCMRTFEVPAVGACMLTEDTEEHRDIFGPEGEAVCYFGSIEELVEKAKWLSREHETRQRLAERAHRVVVEGRNTYRDRLVEVLSVAGFAA